MNPKKMRKMRVRRKVESPGGPAPANEAPSPAKTKKGATKRILIRRKVGKAAVSPKLMKKN